MLSTRLLHHERVVASDEAPHHWFYLFHGIYGAGRNWATVARRVVRERPEWGAELVDLREHGSSRGFPPPHTIEAAAVDVASLAESLGERPAAVLGHSFGGKVALMFARRFGGADQSWIVDSTPDAGRTEGDAVRMLEAVRRNPGPFASREAAVRALEGEGIDTPVAQWMATNVEPVEHGHRWRLDFDAMEELIEDFSRVDLWDVVESPLPGVEIHFVKGESSGVLSAEACARIEAAGRRTGRVFLHRVAGGHWLNAENPDAVVGLLVGRLPGRRRQG